MDYEIRQEQKRKIAGFHMVGPWEHTVKQGFEQLMTWVDRQRIVPVEWIAVYYDNPDVVPAEKLRCDTVVSVAENFILPDNSEGVIVTPLKAANMPLLSREWKTVTLRSRGNGFLTSSSRIALIR